MKTVEVCLTPELIHLFDLPKKVVVIADILRASSCMVTALSEGVTSIKAFADLDACKAMQNHGYITAGERGGEKVEGFDLGNSPLAFRDRAFNGKKIAYTTTNGTQAIIKSAMAENIIIGAFLNISAISDYVKSQGKPVVIFCAGWKGMFSMEDTLFAGALVTRLQENFEIADDAGLASRQLYLAANQNLFEFLKQSSHFKRLSRLHIEDDIRFCLQEDVYHEVPMVENGVIKLN